VSEEPAGAPVRFTPDRAELGERLDAVVARRAGAPRAAVQAALRAGLVTVSGRRARPSHRLAAGEVVAGRLPARPGSELRPEALPLVVRHSDERVLVVSKPPGLVTHPAAGHAGGTLVNALVALGEPLARRATDRPGIVHRLDKDTSGLLLVAKDDDAHARLVAALRARRVERRYLALVAGAMAAPTGTIDAPLGRHPRRARQRAVVAGGAPATSHYRVLGATGEVSLLEVALATGRTHQIRVHLAHVGHPVVGDPTYGAGTAALARRLGLARPFLHAYRLAWPDPGGGGRREVTDELPGDLVEALRRAGMLARAPLDGVGTKDITVIRGTGETGLGTQS
jgi:23S rRNA pseudouridine1911/1915/1917 synthase